MNLGGNDSQQDKLRAVLEAYGGDIDAAINALHAYRASSARPVTPKRETSNTPVLITVEHLGKTYKRGRQKVEVLKDVNLTIHKGEFVAITGASGSGKSTLLQLIGGLDKPTTGDVRFGDVSLSKLSDSKLSQFRGQTIGFVFQFFYLQPFLRLEQNLEVPAMFARTKRSERKNHAAELAKKIGLTDRISHLPKELSGGQMQRAAIARALMNNPQVLLADEPTGNLDSVNGRAIIELFETIRRELGTTIVIVTHDASIAARADREITVSDGRLT